MRPYFTHLHRSCLLSVVSLKVTSLYLYSFKSRNSEITWIRVRARCCSAARASACCSLPAAPSLTTHLLSVPSVTRACASQVSVILTISASTRTASSSSISTSICISTALHRLTQTTAPANHQPQGHLSAFLIGSIK